MRRADRIKPARRERPHDNALAVNTRLCVHPVEQRAPLAVRARRIGRVRRGVARAGDLDNHRADAGAPKALSPHGELGAVAVEAGEDDDAGGGAEGRGGGGEEVVDGNLSAFVWKRIGVRDEDFLHGVLAETGTGVREVEVQL